MQQQPYRIVAILEIPQPSTGVTAVTEIRCSAQEVGCL